MLIVCTCVLTYVAVQLQTTTAVKDGEEFLIDYGDEYWDDIEKVRKKRRRKPAKTSVDGGEGAEEGKGRRSKHARKKRGTEGY